ncbi:MFS transporter [Paenibacillus aquistagni]|uniref:Multidrug resistance protein n=1 Tax=Paenibacillus aquistagni TaxID=1852522 RepID=A0A1X7IHY0_9BACL|nr:MFS transporter [Paenibacillus aquistagni]SMG14024.1 Multidrug resistance protein [Paenibacillus aquistagni]
MKKPLFVVVLMLMMVFIGFGIIIPVLPRLITDAGANEFHLGLMLSIYSLISFVLSPLWGGLSERVGRRPVILIGIFGFSLSYLLFALADGQLWLMYVSRILGGLFAGAVTAVIVAYVADMTTEETRTKGMGLVGAAIGLGFTFGPAFGGLLSRYGLFVPFAAASLLTLITAILGVFWLKESLPKEKRQQRAAQASRWTAFAGRMKYLYVLSFFVTFTLAGLEATLLYFQAVRIPDVTTEDIGWMFFFCGLAGALVQGGVVRRYIKKGGEHKAIFAGLLLSALGFVLLLFSSSFWNATIYLCIFGIGNALIRPCVTSLITQKSTVSHGVASGLNSSMDSFGRITGPLLATAVFSLHVNLPFVIGAVLSVGALGLLFKFVALDRAGNRERMPA